MLFVLITAVLLTFLITTFLTVASRITQGTQDYIRAQRSMYGDMSASKVSLASYLDADPNNDFVFNPTAPGSPETGLLSDGTYYERAVEESGNDLRIDLVAESGGSSRRLEALMSSASLANADIEVVLVLDRSKSMEENERLVKTQAAGDLFLEKFDQGAGTSNAKIGIVTFATWIETIPANGQLTNDVDALRSQLAAVDIPSDPVDGSTSMGEGLNHAYQMLSNDPNTSKFVILLTDGAPSVEPSTAEVQVIWPDYDEWTLTPYYGRGTYGQRESNGRCKPWEGHVYWSSCNSRARRWPIEMGIILRDDTNTLNDPCSGDNCRTWRYNSIPTKDATIWAIAAPGSNTNYLAKVTNVNDQVISVTNANFEDELNDAFARIAAGIVGQRVLYLQELTPEE